MRNILVTLRPPYNPTAANTVQITVQIYSDIVELFVQYKTCLPYRSALTRSWIINLLLDVLVCSIAFYYTAR